MSQPEQLYTKIGQELKRAEFGQMFGKLCLKLEGKAFVAFFQEEMVFKLTGKDHEEALKLKEAQLFDPSGKGRPMKEWVQVPFIYKGKWKGLAEKAMNYAFEKANREGF